LSSPFSALPEPDLGSDCDETTYRHEPGGSVRAAEPADVPAILRLINELAVYEKEPESVEATDAHLRAALFPPDQAPTAFAHVGVVDGSVVGMAIWYVDVLDLAWPQRHLAGGPVRVARTSRSGLGKQLLATLAQLCSDARTGGSSGGC